MPPGRLKKDSSLISTTEPQCLVPAWEREKLSNRSASFPRGALVIPEFLLSWVVGIDHLDLMQERNYVDMEVHAPIFSRRLGYPALRRLLAGAQGPRPTARGLRQSPGRAARQVYARALHG